MWAFGFYFLFICFLTLAFLPLFCWVRWRDYIDKRQGRRTPLTQGLLRAPGQALLSQIDELRLDLIVYILVCPLALSACVGAQFVNLYFTHKKLSYFLLGVLGIISISLLVWSGSKTISGLKKLKALRLGWQGEVATAEELNKLMRHGYEVFHDVPAERFNIDHIAVGPSGVYAVETKTRTKRASPRSDSGRFWQATFDGQFIDFSGYRTQAPLEQAARQAKWVSEWLSKATGEFITAMPVVALPGWMVERKGRGEVQVINSKEAEKIIRGKPRVLEMAQIRRIVHQLEQQCREPVK